MDNFELDIVPLWEKLDLDQNFTIEQVEAAYDKTWEADDDRFLAWNVLHDPWYAEAYRKLPSLDATVDAGFVSENTTSRQYRQFCIDERLLTLPFDKLTFDEALANPTVILSTGGFYPVHEGHLAMMEKARQTLEDAGYDIIGGYMSLSHEGYISTKPYYVDGPFERFRQCAGILESSDWIMPDPWESLYIGVPVNFTDVIAHVSLRLEKYLGRKVNVAYVFGADNASFVRCFEKEGIAVCVEREGYEKAFENVGKISEMNKRIFAVKNNDPSVKATSRDIRKNMNPVCFPEDKNIFLLRDEKAKSLTCLSKHIEDPASYQNAFIRHLSKAIEKAFDYRVHVQIEDLDSQITFFNKQTFEYPVISLDPYCKGKFNLGVSRLFNACSIGNSHPVFTSRPECPDLQSQLAKIASGSYILVDDDSFTGSTISFVEGMLPENINIASTFFLAEYNRDQVIDLADARDFIIGAELGGLVGHLFDGTSIRMPYLLPYADIAARMSIPPENTLEFSKDIWNFNASMLAKYAPEFEMKDLPAPIRRLFTYVGFDENRKLYDICLWHAHVLENATSRI